MQIGLDGLFQSLYLRKWAAKVEGGITMKTRKSAPRYEEDAGKYVFLVVYCVCE